MRRIFLILSVSILLVCKANAQLECGNQTHFSGNSYFTVDGSVTDWTTFFTIPPSSISATQPTSLINSGNFTFDNYCTGLLQQDLDQPLMEADLKLSAFVSDANNVYFYLRNASAEGGAQTVYYFLDLNADGFMNNGEPVLVVFFNSNKVLRYSLAKYIVNTSADYVPGKGNFMYNPSTHMVDGYSLTGTVQELFNSESAQVSLLNNDQSFNASVTEDGIGLELSIPWSFLKNWNLSTPYQIEPGDIFSYHIALKKGGGNYSANKIVDNMSACCGRLGYVGNMSVETVHASMSTVIPGLKYRIILQYRNPTNITETIAIPRIDVIGQSYINLAGLTTATLIKDINCDENTSGESASNYTIIGGMLRNVNTAITMAPGQSACYIIDIEFSQPVNYFRIDLKPEVSGIDFHNCLPIICTIIGEGGRPINPIGFTETVDEVTMRKPVEENELVPGLLKIFPNPGNGNLTIRFPQSTVDYQVSLSDNLGKRMKIYDRVKTSLQITGLKNGVYFLQITNMKTRITETRKIIVQK